MIKLVALLLRANQYLQQHPEKSAALVARWLERPLPVEKLSLPTIKYLVSYPDHWHSGVEYWIASMNQQGRMQGSIKAAVERGNIETLLYDMSIYEKAHAEMERE